MSYIACWRHQYTREVCSLRDKPGGVPGGSKARSAPRHAPLRDTPRTTPAHTLPDRKSCAMFHPSRNPSTDLRWHHQRKLHRRRKLRPHKAGKAHTRRNLVAGLRSSGLHHRRRSPFCASIRASAHHAKNNIVGSIVPF